MDKIRFYIYVFFTYLLNFGLIYYIASWANNYTATSVTLGFGCILLILSFTKNLHPAREMFFSVISIAAIGLVTWKLASPYVCGISGIFTALLYICLMYKYVWTGLIQVDKELEQKDNNKNSKKFTN